MIFSDSALVGATPRKKISSLAITIEIANSDFESSSEYVSAVIVGGHTFGTDYLVSGGEDDNCGKLSKIVDSEVLPVSALSESGDLEIRIETSSAVNAYPCDGSYLHAKVSIAVELQSGGTADCQ